MVKNEQIQPVITRLIGKRVTITLKSGAMYSGRIWRRGTEYIVLSDLCIHTSFGATIASKNKRERTFHIDKLRMLVEA